MSQRKPRKTKKKISPKQTKGANRAVDAAMASERLAKQSVRKLWLEQHLYYNEQFPDDDAPLLLTLCGEEAREIRFLVQHGIIKLTETGAIAEESINRVIAIERSPGAVLKLQEQFPGLKIIQQDFKALIGGDNLRRFPHPKQEPLFCAKVINLDLQEPLHERELEGSIEFPVLTWVRKLCQIHAGLNPRVDWCLCLTLNGKLAQSQADGTVTWSRSISEVMKAFLTENFQRLPDFEASCQLLLGDELYHRIRGIDLLDFSALTQEEQQKLLMVFVPKKIAQLVHDQNWQVRTTWNLRYGGHGNHAPMVTWILSFIWDPRASSMPDAVYKDSLRNILTAAGRIDDDGQIQATSLIEQHKVTHNIDISKI